MKRAAARPPFFLLYPPKFKLVQLVTKSLDAVGDQALGAVLVQPRRNQLLGRVDGGIGGEAADFVQRRGFGLGDFVLGGGGAARDLGFQRGAGFLLELGGLGVGSFTGLANEPGDAE